MSGRVILPAPTYWLATHVHACLSGTHVVLLDLRKNRYLAVDAAEASGLQGFVADWPAPQSRARRDERPADSATPEDLLAAVDTMLKQGLIAEVPQKGRAAGVQQERRAPRLLFETVVEQPSPPRLREIVAFTRATLTSKLESQLLPVRYVIGAFERRRKRLGSPAIELVRVQQAVLGFMRLRPFLFRSRDACLFNCLALARYLSHFGIPCHCVFGVQDSPFAAHCWLLYEDRVLNDTPEHVSQYTPILCV